MYWPDAVMMKMDPMVGIRRLQREVNRLFDGSSLAEGSEGFPAVNMWSNAEQVTVTAEIPGVEAKDLDIHVQGGHLTIKGERKDEALSKDVVCHRLERESGAFIRTFRLPYEVDSSKVVAKYSQGLLRVTLPRTEASKPKKIAIAAE